MTENTPTSYHDNTLKQTRSYYAKDLSLGFFETSGDVTRGTELEITAVNDDIQFDKTDSGEWCVASDGKVTKNRDEKHRNLSKVEEDVAVTCEKTGITRAEKRIPREKFPVAISMERNFENGTTIASFLDAEKKYIFHEIEKEKQHLNMEREKYVRLDQNRLEIDQNWLVISEESVGEVNKTFIFDGCPRGVVQPRVSQSNDEKKIMTQKCDAIENQSAFEVGNRINLNYCRKKSLEKFANYIEKDKNASDSLELQQKDRFYGDVNAIERCKVDMESYQETNGLHEGNSLIVGQEIFITNEPKNKNIDKGKNGKSYSVGKNVLNEASAVPDEDFVDTEVGIIANHSKDKQREQINVPNEMGSVHDKRLVKNESKIENIQQPSSLEEKLLTNCHISKTSNTLRDDLTLGKASGSTSLPSTSRGHRLKVTQDSSEEYARFARTKSAPQGEVFGGREKDFSIRKQDRRGEKGLIFDRGEIENNDVLERLETKGDDLSQPGNIPRESSIDYQEIVTSNYLHDKEGKFALEELLDGERLKTNEDRFSSCNFLTPESAKICLANEKTDDLSDKNDILLSGEFENENRLVSDGFKAMEDSLSSSNSLTPESAKIYPGEGTEENISSDMGANLSALQVKRRMPSLGTIAMLAYYTDDYFKQFERENLSERRELKKDFKAKIAEAKKTLREARKKAQEQTVARRFDEAVKKHREMQLRRVSIRNSSSLSKSSATSAKLDARKRLTNAISDVIIKKKELEVREIHKAEAQLGRATIAKKTKERLTKTANVDLVSRPTSIKARMRRDRERMERYEVEYLISELKFLNMDEYAVKLVEALECKEELETSLRSQLAEKRKMAADMTRRRKLEEQARIRERERIRRLEEKERRERERLEREAIERELRRQEAIKQREKNLKLWELYNFTVLTTDKSRSFTYSYLPALKSPQTKEEKPKKVKLKEIKSRYMFR